MTGAGTGIDKGLALAFMREGYFVTLAGRCADMLKKTVDEAGPGKKIVLFKSKGDYSPCIRKLFVFMTELTMIL